MIRTAPLLALIILLGVPLFAHAQGFVPLTSVPAFKEIGGQGGLSGFLNQLYVLCVGAAAVIAVIQLVRAGMLYSLGDSFTEKKEAKHLITMSLLGLILVLSPTIVFGIINPSILELRIDTTTLQTSQTGPFAGSGGAGGAGGSYTLQGNKWGTLDNLCKFGANSSLRPISDLYAKQVIELGEFGNGKGIDAGRQCCVVAGGKTGVRTKIGEGTEEVCDLDHGGAGELIGTDTRYAASIKGKALIMKEDDSGDSVEADFHLFTPGFGGETWSVDADTLAIHGFRSKSECEAFVSQSSYSIEDTFKNARIKSSGEQVGLLEGSVNYNGWKELYPRNVLVRIVSSEGKCYGATFKKL